MFEQKFAVSTQRAYFRKKGDYAGDIATDKFQT